MHKLGSADLPSLEQLELNFRGPLYKNNLSSYHAEISNLPFRTFLQENSLNFVAFGKREASGDLSAAMALCFSDEAPIAYLSLWPFLSMGTGGKNLEEIFTAVLQKVKERGYRNLYVWVLTSQEPLMRGIEQSSIFQIHEIKTVENIPAGTRAYFLGFWNYLQLNLVANEKSRVVEFKL